MIKLSPRLLALARLVPSGSRVADVGTDHAYLPIYLVKQGIANFCIGSELNPGPYQAAGRAVKNYGLEAEIDVRKGNGLETIKPGEVDVVVIAGMGGGTIVEILEGSKAVVAELKGLVLQPMVGAAQLRRWLTANGWKLVSEDLVEDDGRIYEVLFAQPGQESIEDEIIFELGPRLLEREHELYHRHIAKLIEGEEKVISQLAHSKQEEAKVRAEQIKRRISRIKEVLLCRLKLQI